jgi:hypothetical protein
VWFVDGYDGSGNSGVPAADLHQVVDEFLEKKEASLFDMFDDGLADYLVIESAVYVVITQGGGIRVVMYLHVDHDVLPLRSFLRIESDESAEPEIRDSDDG